LERGRQDRSEIVELPSALELERGGFVLDAPAVESEITGVLAVRSVADPLGLQVDFRIRQTLDL
jgi:hypothetical protein